ncbi:MAG: right-handed parallel beta-helix repeat-containing protein [Victivallales bacterium]|nr:right-handed parallel beta-helix repeat-containing protein [Victivallales bacterium]
MGDPQAEEPVCRQVMSRALLACLVGMGMLHAATATTFVVAPGGSDGWGGRLPEANATRTDGPFATVVRARDAVRQARRDGGGGPFVIELRGGLHTLTEPLTLTPEDSGTAAAPTIFRAYAGERPIISGGRPITGFSETTFNGLHCWRAELPQVRAGWRFAQLYARRRGTATFQRRYRPVKGMLVIAGLTYSPERKASPHRSAQQDFRFFPGDFKKFANLADVEVVALHAWSASRLCVESVDLDRNVVRFTSMPTFRIGHWYRAGRNPYYIENVKEEVRRPGQWYLDTPSGMLYYVRVPGETMANTEIVAPFLEQLVKLEGDVSGGRFVEHVVFERLTFAHTNWTTPKSGYDVSQGQPSLPAAIKLKGARDCTITRCTVAHTGAYAIELGSGGQENLVAGCSLYDLGGGGVKVGDPGMAKTATAPILPTGNTVENNAIMAGGRVHFSANGVWAGIVKKLTIQHNEIRDFPYTGVALGWSWGYAKTSCAENTIAYNHIHNVMRLLEDGGGIYTLGQQPGTVIRGNLIHDCLMGPFACTFGQLGIYLDEGSGPFQIEDNIVYNVQMGAFNQHYGRGSMVENNIFANVVQEPITCARNEDHLSYTFRRNIVYLTTGNMISTRHNPGGCNTVFQDNLYWDPSGEEPLFGAGTFAEWQATGRDTQSIIADPGFMDAAAFDFRLRPKSPALKLGFRPLDPAGAGLEQDFRDLANPSLCGPEPPVYTMSIPELPEPKPGLDLDFEDVPPGFCPRQLSRAGCLADKGDFIVTEEVAHGGKRCLKGYEATELRKPFYPYLTYRMAGKAITSGTVHLSLAAMNSREAPAQVSIEIRDYANSGAKEFLSGPTLFLRNNGEIATADKVLGRVANGEWVKIDIDMKVGPDAPKTCTVTLTGPDGVPKTATVPYIHTDFAAASWFGIVSNGQAPCAFYIDDLLLTVQPAAAE